MPASLEQMDLQSAAVPLPPTVALLLQGGGALGSYQAGVFSELVRQNVRIDWVAGISIGAINSAIIAGNEPHVACERLREFWELVTSGSPNFVWGDSDALREINHFAGAAAAAAAAAGGVTLQHDGPTDHPQGVRLSQLLRALRALPCALRPVTTSTPCQCSHTGLATLGRKKAGLQQSRWLRPWRCTHSC